MRAGSRGIGFLVQRDGYVRFGGGHQVDRQAVLLERSEHIGEKTDFLPHARRFHGDQHDPGLRGDRLDLRADVGDVIGDNGSRQVRSARAFDMDRDAPPLRRFDAPGMQDLGPHGRQFLRFGVVQLAEQAGRGNVARVRGEHARHVRPDFDAFGAERGPKAGSGGVGAAASEQNRLSGPCSKR